MFNAVNVRIEALQARKADLDSLMPDLNYRLSQPRSYDENKVILMELKFMNRELKSIRKQLAKAVKTADKLMAKIKKQEA